MSEYKLRREDITGFAQNLQRGERSPGTIAKYERDVCAFARWLWDRTVDRQEIDREQQQQGQDDQQNLFPAGELFAQLHGWPPPSETRVMVMTRDTVACEPGSSFVLAV